MNNLNSCNLDGSECREIHIQNPNNNRCVDKTTPLGKILSNYKKFAQLKHDLTQNNEDFSSDESDSGESENEEVLSRRFKSVNEDSEIIPEYETLGDEEEEEEEESFPPEENLEEEIPNSDDQIYELPIPESIDYENKNFDLSEKELKILNGIHNIPNEVEENLDTELPQETPEILEDEVSFEDDLKPLEAEIFYSSEVKPETKDLPSQFHLQQYVLEQNAELENKLKKLISEGGSNQEIILRTLKQFEENFIRQTADELASLDAAIHRLTEENHKFQERISEKVNEDEKRNHEFIRSYQKDMEDLKTLKSELVLKATKVDEQIEHWSEFGRNFSDKMKEEAILSVQNGIEEFAKNAENSKNMHNEHVNLGKKSLVEQAELLKNDLQQSSLTHLESKFEDFAQKMKDLTNEELRKLTEQIRNTEEKIGQFESSVNSKTTEAVSEATDKLVKVIDAKEQQVKQFASHFDEMTQKEIEKLHTTEKDIESELKKIIEEKETQLHNLVSQLDNFSQGEIQKIQMVEQSSEDKLRKLLEEKEQQIRHLTQQIEELSREEIHRIETLQHNAEKDMNSILVRDEQIKTEASALLNQISEITHENERNAKKFETEIVNKEHEFESRAEAVLLNVQAKLQASENTAEEQSKDVIQKSTDLGIEEIKVSTETSKRNISDLASNLQSNILASVEEQQSRNRPSVEEMIREEEMPMTDRKSVV